MKDVNEQHRTLQMELQEVIAGGGAGYRSELRLYPHLGYGICVMGNETSYDTGTITSMLVSAPAYAGSTIDSTRTYRL